MKITKTFRNAFHNALVDDFIEEKGSKLSKYIKNTGKSGHLHLICSQKDGIHSSSITLSGPHYEYTATAKDNNMLKAVSKGLKKIERQVSKMKDSGKNHLHRKDRKDPEILTPEEAWTDYDEDEFDDVA